MIIEALKKVPGQKASEIAIAIGVDKKQINSILYGNLKDKCTQNERYYWYLNEDVPSNKEPERKAISKTVLSNLSYYYLSCLGQGDEGGISVFADSKYGDLDYAELKYLPLNQNDALFESEEVRW